MNSKEKYSISIEVQSWIEVMDEDEQELFKNSTEKDLIQFHMGLGRYIRNEFLWKNTNYKPEIRDGVDYSKNHPDNLSMEIIKMVWNRMKNT